MELHIPVPLMVALYAASIAIVVLAAVCIHVLWRLRNQIDRTLTAVQHLEAELTPLAREAREAVDRLGDFSDRVQRVFGAASALLLPPAVALNRTAHIIQTGATTFLRALWNGRQKGG